jgi:hypothetical protein
MSQQIENEAYIRRYLLGDLSDEERQEVEKRLLSDEDFYQQVLLAEDELAYDFVCDELTETEKARFRQHALPVPERRQDVKFARALRKYVRNNAPPETPVIVEKRASWLEAFAGFFRLPAIGLALATALLVAIALSIWTVIQNRGLQKQIAQLEAQKTPPATPLPQDLQAELSAERQRSAALAEQLRSEQELRASAERNLEEVRDQSQRVFTSDAPPRTSVATVLSFLLSPGISRDSGEGKKIPIPQGAREIRLLLDLAADDYRSYSASLISVDDRKELLSWQMLLARTVASGKAISLNVPAKLLTPGDYQIQLNGETPAGRTEDIEHYYFRATKTGKQ